MPLDIIQGIYSILQIVHQSGDGRQSYIEDILTKGE